MAASFSLSGVDLNDTDLFHSIFVNAPFPIELYSEDGRLLAANKACLSLFGVDSFEDVKGLSFFDNPNVPSDAKARLQAGDQVTYTTDFDFALVHKLSLYKTARQGSLHLECTLTPWTNSKGLRVAFLVYIRDLTQARHNERRLRSLSRAIEQSTSSIVITNTKGLIEYVNPAFSRNTGYGSQEIIGANPRILKSGLMTQDAYRKMWTTIGGGEVWHGEFLNRKKSGELYWEQASISPVKDDAGAIIQYIAVKEDITERKLSRGRNEMQLSVARVLTSEESIQSAAEKLCSTVAQALSCGCVEFWQANPDRTSLACLALSTSKAQHTGYLTDAAKDKVIRAQEDFRMQTLRNMADVRFTTPTMASVLATPIRSTRGSEGVLVVGDLLRMDASLSNTLTSVCSQIGQFIHHLRTETELRRLALVAQHTSDMILISDPQGKAIWVNEAFQKETGFTQSEIHGHNPGQLLQGTETDLQTSALVSEAVKEHRSVQAELIIHRKDKSSCWIDLSLHPVKNPGGELVYFIAISSVISRRKAMEADLIAAREAAEAANKTKGAFLANISHELRTPLNAILGFAQLLNHDTALRETHLQHVRAIEQSGEELLGLINAIIDVTKVVSATPDTTQVHQFSRQSRTKSLQSMRRLFTQNFHLAPDPGPSRNRTSAQTSENTRESARQADPLRLGIVEAARTADIEKLGVLLQQLTKENPALASSLKVCADNFDYDRLLKTLETSGTNPA